MEAVGDGPEWRFFNSRAELDNFNDWLHSDDVEVQVDKALN
jgi:hypothetical protein